MLFLFKAVFAWIYAHSDFYVLTWTKRANLCSDGQVFTLTSRVFTLIYFPGKYALNFGSKGAKWKNAKGGGCNYAHLEENRSKSIIINNSDEHLYWCFFRGCRYTLCVYIYIMCVYVFAILLYHLQGCYCLRHSHSTTIIVHLWQIPGCDILADLVDGLCFWGAIWQDLGATCPTIAYPKSVFDSGWGWLGITPKKKGRSVSKMKRHRMDKRAARTRSPKFGASWKKSLALRRPRVPMPQVKHSWAAR